MKEERKTNTIDVLLYITQISLIIIGFLLIIIPAITEARISKLDQQSEVTAVEETTVTRTEPSVDVSEASQRSLNTYRAVVRQPLNPRSMVQTDETEAIITEPEIVEIDEMIGTDNIEIDGHHLTRKALPDEYYGDIDFSSFQPYMDFRTVTEPNSSSYPVVYNDNAYNDENGFRRVSLSDDDFQVNGEDDYMIGLGTYYKPKSVGGLRFLIVTSTGMYTAITGDEKADKDTDELHMFSSHGDHGELAGMIEWIVNTDDLEKSIRRSGTVSESSNEILQGDIEYIYLIED